jgi:hypothetical protein
MINGTKIITLCGSSRFCDIMAVCAWIIERDEHAITMGLHLLPDWYFNHPVSDHLAEEEGCASDMDKLHFRKIELSDEIFVVNVNEYIGKSTGNEINHALELNKPIRYFTLDPIGKKVIEIIENQRNK